MKAYEYLASGCPVVASRTPALEAILGENVATFCEPDTPEALARAITEACSNPNLEHIRKGRELAEAHSWQSRAVHVLDAIHAL